MDNVELNLDKFQHKNSFLLVVIRYLSTKAHNWYTLDKTTYEDSNNETITLCSRLINEATQILEILSSCIDFVFISNLIWLQSESLFFSNSHYQFLFENFNLQIYYPRSKKIPLFLKRSPFLVFPVA